jgi:outer membrane biosynthesis protein TonB
MMTSTILLILLTVAAPPQAPECKEWHECQKLALEAAERQDYNAFHDLSWRALQTGPKNDPTLMTMLARAQSLSGRPHDALVMLQRLASMGVNTDAETNDDFRFVRALPAWADFEARLKGLPPPPKPAPAAPPGTTTPTTPTPATAKPADPPATAKRGRAAGKPSKEELAKPDAAKPEATKPETAKPEATKAEVPTTPEPSKAESTPAAETKPAAPRTGNLMFSAPGLTAVGFGYDAVSGRFIVGDRKDRRLLVVGERSGRLASLAGVDAGFDEVSAFEIDSVEGDLWVTSASSQSRTSTLHKLQLISGRVLTSIALPAGEGPSRFADVAVTPQNILVLDSEGRRVYRVAKKGRTLDLVARIAVPDSTSIAPGAEGIAYAAYDQGIIRLDTATRAMTVVEPAADVDLSGVRWIRWHRGSLVAIQGSPAGPFKLLRIRLDDAGRRARGMDVLDSNVTLAGPNSAAVTGNVVYYLAPATGDQVEVKKLTLK